MPQTPPAKIVVSLSICGLLVAIAGCSSEPADVPKTPVTYAPPLESEGSQKNSPDAGKTGKVGPFEKKFEGISFAVPEGWREVDLAPGQQGFVDARFVVPSQGNDLQLTFLSAKGGIDMNVERWVGQFQMPAGETPKHDSFKVGNVEAKLVELHGTFNSGMMKREAPRENWRMIGVGIPMGDHEFYLKLTGPGEAVAAIRDQFRDFVKSAKLSQ